LVEVEVLTLREEELQTRAENAEWGHKKGTSDEIENWARGPENLV
jgi:hypothetical protein